MFDILIRNGWIADGTGNPRYPADIGVAGDYIAYVGRDRTEPAMYTIDATGKIVCPGFVDCHSHSDSTILMNLTADSTIRQGITTEIVGNCGNSPAPLSEHNRTTILDPLGVGSDNRPRWSTFADFLYEVEDRQTTPNLAWFVGHNTVRRAAGVIGSEVTGPQLGTMQKMVAEAMDAGALGLSTGLEFDPGRRATTQEIIALARVVGERDGYYASHIRNRAKHLQEAVEEFVEIVRASGTHGQISHLNVRYNTGAPEGAWERAVATIEQAREAGLDILADCTPYLDGGGGPTAILPMWVTEEGPECAAALLRDPEVREKVKQDADRYWAFIQRGDWDRVRISSSSNHPEIVGKSLAEIADMWDEDPWGVLLDLFVETLSGEGRVSYIGRLFTDEHVTKNIQHPLFCLSVDAATVSAEGPLKDRYVHPLPFAGMVHYLTTWVREKGVLRLEEAIRKMTSMPATRFNLDRRGLIREGSYADIVVFDYDDLDDGATLDNPVAYCRGVEYVLVNGRVVVEQGEHTGIRPGVTLTYGGPNVTMARPTA